MTSACVQHHAQHPAVGTSLHPASSMRLAKLQRMHGLTFLRPVAIFKHMT